MTHAPDQGTCAVCGEPVYQLHDGTYLSMTTKTTHCTPPPSEEAP